MEEDNSMSERILNDIQNIIYNDAHLKEFCIVPISENKNKSPVLYEEHNLGLELWCVKHVYRYIYTELFKVRLLLKANRLPQYKTLKLNQLLMGALLIHPDVSTFWNMRRELIEYGEINLDKELLLTELVLSHKSKSNEAFTYRKWVLNKYIKRIPNDEIHLVTFLLIKEFAVTEMAADKSQNNYHAWSHRIWCMQNIALKRPLIDTPEYLNLILSELDFSFKWIHKHVSEHGGYHYRQYLCQCILSNTNVMDSQYIKYHMYIEPVLGFKVSGFNNCSFLTDLLGKRGSLVNVNSAQDVLKCYNYYIYFTVLLSDLFCFIERLNETFPSHESIWYHRRFIVYHLLKAAYEYHGITWKRNVKLNDMHETNCQDINITLSNLGGVGKGSILQENGEKCPKLLKYEFDKVESSYLYKILIETENKFIRENNSEKCSDEQRDLAVRHDRWLRYVLCLCKM